LPIGVDQIDEAHLDAEHVRGQIGYPVEPLLARRIQHVEGAKIGHSRRIISRNWGRFH
jgi:hypothetical protein